MLYAIGLLTALLTSFYMFRLIFLTFFGKQRYDEHHVHVHESPKSMLVPLMILAVLSIVGGWLAAPAFWGGPDYFAKFLEPGLRARQRGPSPAPPKPRPTPSKLRWPSSRSSPHCLASASPYWLYISKPQQTR